MSSHSTFKTWASNWDREIFVHTGRLLLVFLSANASACRRSTGNLSLSVFVFVLRRVDRITQQERSLSTLRCGSCGEVRLRNVSFDAALLCSPLCHFLVIDGEAQWVVQLYINGETQILKTSLVSRDVLAGIRLCGDVCQKVSEV